MPEFDIVFEKFDEMTHDEGDREATVDLTIMTTAELDEIDELRRFSAELHDPEPPSFTTT